jgi:NTP pyrophosphatase (non-canonical NTP hydrolase)
MSYSLEVLIDLAKRKHRLDSQGDTMDAHSYLQGIKSEIEEVEEELHGEQVVYLEDELGDVLWDYISLLVTLDSDNRITLEQVLTHVEEKYQERVSGLEDNIPWDEIKKDQKTRLKARQEREYTK